MTPDTTNTPTWMDEIAYTDDVSMTYTRLLAYGPMGSGKTKFALSWPSPFVIDTDHGLLTVRSERFPAVPIHAPRDRKDRRRVYRKILDILVEARDRSGPFADDGPFADVQTIVLDGYTALADSMMKEILLEDGLDHTKDKPQFDHWMSLSARLDNLTQLSMQLPYNFVGTCGNKQEKDEQSGGWVGLPDIIGGYRNDIGFKFDEVWYFEPRRARASDGASRDSLIYEAHTAKYRIFDAKSRLGLPSTIVNPTYEQVAPYLHGETP